MKTVALLLCSAAAVLIVALALHLARDTRAPSGIDHPNSPWSRAHESAREARSSSSSSSARLANELPESATLHDRDAASTTLVQPVAVRPFEVTPPSDAELARWSAKYGDSSLGDLGKAQASFAISLSEACMPIFDEYYARGEFEVLGMNGRVKVANWDDRPLTMVRCPSGDSPDQRVVKLTIRERDYPDLYERQREYIWLRERVRERTELAFR